MDKKLMFLLLFIAGIQFGLLAQTGIECKNCDTSRSEIGKDTIPRERISINGKEGGRIDSCELIAWDSIIVLPPASNYNSVSYNVHYYQCIVQTKVGAKVFSVYGSKLRADLLDCIAQCRKNDLIIFFNFKVYREGEQAKTIESGPVFRMQ